MSAEQELAAIADYIEEHGHAVGVFLAPDGAVCPLGALVLTRQPVETRPGESFWEAAGRITDEIESIESIDRKADRTYRCLQDMAMAYKGHRSIPMWADNTPTEDLLAQLRGTA